jgi:hypothetical protein
MSSTDSVSRPRRLLAHGLELAILCLLLAGCALALLAPAVLFAPIQGHGFTRPPETAWEQFRLNLAFAGGLVPYLGVVLLLSRAVRRRWLFLVLADLWLVAVPVYLYFRYSYPVYYGLLKHWPEILGEPGVMVPTQMVGIFLVVPIAAAVLGGLYGVRKGFAWWKYGAGAAVGMVAAYVVLFWGVPFQPTVTQVLGFAMTGVFAFALILLPLQRAALERLTGTGLRPGAASPSAGGWGWWTSLLGHATLGGFLAAAVFGGFLGDAIIRSLALYLNGPPPGVHAPGEVNAFEFWHAVIQRTPRTGPRENTLRSECLSLLSEPTSPRENQEYWEGLDPQKVEAAFGAYQKEFDELRTSRQADYFDPRDPDTGRQVPIEFITLRHAGRRLAARTLWLLYRDKPGEALELIRDQFGVARLLRESTAPLLAYLMISSFERMAVQTGYSYLLAERDDRDAVGGLLALLQEEAGRVRQPFPAGKVRASNFAFRSMVPYFEINAPRLDRAVAYYYLSWVEFDQLILATAAEAWRLDHGGQYPDSATLLVPEYLDRIPLDPFLGSPYSWNVENGELVIGSGDGELPGPALPFPASEVANPKLLKCVQQSDREKAEGRNGTWNEDENE